MHSAKVKGILSQLKKIAALFLSIVILLTAFPVSAFADEFETVQPEETVLEARADFDAQIIESEEPADIPEAESSTGDTEESETGEEPAYENAEDELPEGESLEVAEDAEVNDTSKETEEPISENVEGEVEEEPENLEETEEPEETEEEDSSETAEVAEEEENSEEPEETEESGLSEETETDGPELVEMIIDLSDKIELIGLLPRHAVIVAVPAEIEIEGEEVLAAFDISIYVNEEARENGTVWQPEEGSVTVRIKDSSFGSLSLNVYHTPEGGVPQYITTVDAVDGTVEFEAAGFSVWTVSRTIEKTIVTSDGSTYRITVNYGSGAGIPEDASLSVSEVTGEEYENYIGRAEVLMNAGGFAYARVFDISILDGAGNEIQPASSVQVVIELLDDTDSSDIYSVVHFGEEAEKMNSETSGNSVLFTASGFSAYAIVQGPVAVPLGWQRIYTIEELIAKSQEGLYMGHPNGYYYTNTLYVTDANNPAKIRTGIRKTKPAQPYPASGAAKYYFEQAEGTNQFYAYCMNGDEKLYVYNTGTNSLFLGTEDQKTAFTAAVDSSGRFTMVRNGWYWNMQGGDNGERFCAYTTAGDVNNNFYLWYYTELAEEPYGMDGKSYGLMTWNGGVAGKALMASGSEGHLEALPMTVMTNYGNDDDKLFVPDNSDISMWTFHWLHDDKYYITSESDGSTVYLRISQSGLSLVSTPDEDCEISLMPGTGIHAGELYLASGNGILTYTGSVENGFSTGGSTGSEWLKLVEISELTPEYFMTYSARKESVSSSDITNGSRIILYTRVWNDAKGKYEFYAVDHEGNLVPCYESGDSIQWVGSKLNNMLWNLVEYYDETTGQPNYYYELYNQYSEQYIAPQITGNQILSGNTIGINLNGRRNGYYYTTIVAWDAAAYKYAGLKVENGHIVTCPYGDAEDFYFAILEDLPVNDDLTTVQTIDHEQYGITIKITDLNTRAEMSNYLGNDDGNHLLQTTPGLLSTDIKENGYPNVTIGNKSLAGLLNGHTTRQVNHLFVASSYMATGYYEFDSTQNYAYLQSDNNFRVYRELGTHDASSRNTLKHGQFFPFNDIQPGVFASTNPKNLYTATAELLPDGDPRKNERLYLIKNPDYFFMTEIEASFTQTPNGLDAWGHDIIYEFTGDDDFWLYVDGELIIDLGGIHSALPGTVNYSTGDVYVNGEHTTIKDLFYNNFIARGGSAADAQAYVDEIFVQTDRGWVFEEYSTHTMRIFYMERGAGASNLHMRFNLASIKPGTIHLTKELEGVDRSESILAEYPYQIFYRTQEYPEAPLTEHLLAPETVGSATINYVYYKDTIANVPFRESVTVDGIEYSSVYMLKPWDIAEINFPEYTVDYRISECGVNTDVYSMVKVNGEVISGTPRNTGDDTAPRSDFELDWATTRNRSRVVYTNRVNPDALRTLTFRKVLYDETGENEVTNDPTPFAFRLYLGTEFEEDLSLAYLYSYHVKDPDGNYCVWNTANENFDSLQGKTDYSELSNAEKDQATFTTSMNGSIANIPAFYTVEVREILAGTRYMVEEREWEVPDGYSLQKYVMYEDKEDTDFTESFEPVSGIIESDKDPHEDICNLRGWGLRVNKIWTDADYMAHRNDTYFALYTDDGNGNLTLINGSVRRLQQSEDSVYWYYLHLPVPGVAFDNYLAREVVLEGDPVVSDEGVVSGYTDITPVEDGEEIHIYGRQIGENVSSVFDYTVLYEKGVTDSESHVRIDTVTNNRPGIVLEKKTYAGAPLGGAVFTLKDNTGTLIGEFTSDADGLITVAFLRDDVPYILEEIRTPQGYRGIQNPMTVTLSNGTVSFSGTDDYTLTQGGGQMPTLAILNRPYVFRAVKEDLYTGDVLSGVHFALHRQVTVEGVTQIDVNPMPGYEDLVTDENGYIPLITNNLPPGTYELREKAAPSRYLALSGYIRFSISQTGKVTLGLHPPAVRLEEDEQNDGSVLYVLTVPNTPELPAPTGIRIGEHTNVYLALLALGILIGMGSVLPMLMIKRKEDPMSDPDPPPPRVRGETRAGPHETSSGGIPHLARSDIAAIRKKRTEQRNRINKVRIYTLKGIKTMKAMKQITALLLALVMVLCMGTTVFASTTTTTLDANGEQGAFEDKDTPVVQSKTLVLEKELRVYNVDEAKVNAPTITYNYAVAPATVASGTTVTDNANKHTSNTAVTAPVKAGIGNLTASVSWTTADVLDASTDGTKNVKSISLDFSSIVFTGPGVYRYVITESLASGFTYANTGVTETTQTTGKQTRYIDVYVKPADTFTDGSTAAEWDIYGFTCFLNNTSITDADKATTAVKTTGFVDGTGATDPATFLADQYYTYNLTISKTVMGDNYAKTTHAFPFTVIFSNSDATKNVLLKTTVGTGSSDFEHAAGAPTWSGVALVKDGGAIKYIGIPCGTSVEVYETNDVAGVVYTVDTSVDGGTAENDASVNWGNKPTEAVAQAATKESYQSTKANVTTTKNADDDTAHSVAITNKLITISPTGISLRVAPYVLMLAAGVMILFFSRRRRNAYED